MNRTIRLARTTLARRASTAAATADVRPRRALLYLPAHDVKKVYHAAKAVTLGVDCVCLDCEDAVAVNRKEDARQGIIKILQEMDFGSSEVAVRINVPASEAALADINALFTSTKLPHALVVPKVDTPAHLEWLFEKIERAKNKSAHKDSPPLSLITQVESAMGLLNLRAICQLNLEEVSESTALKHEALMFGGDDFAASIGATRTADGGELLLARQLTVVHAKAFNLQAIDIVDINYKDLDHLRAEAAHGAAMGFTGKQIIHPSQVEAVQAAYTPSAARIEWALRVVRGFNASSIVGAGAFSLDGAMIDMPTVLQAQNVLKLAVAAKKLSPDELPAVEQAK